MTQLLATSVIRGARQGESHGGVYLVDFGQDRVEQKIDWNRMDIDWSGRGWDRGLRGIAFGPDPAAPEEIYIAASDELFVYTPDFTLKSSHRCRYLKHCHEISVRDGMLFLTSTGFDALLGFSLFARAFTWGLRLTPGPGGVALLSFDPCSDNGPAPANTLHLNSICAAANGLFFSGLHTPGLLHFDGKTVSLRASLPAGTHNAQPFRDGILFNDTAADMIRYVTPSRQRTFRVPAYDPATLTHMDPADGHTARPGFARGLCAVTDTLIAAGSSPSTLALHDLAENRTVRFVTLSRDVRNAVHGLEVWPF
ncbi:hypothetical protein [Hyphomonas sp.]|uniref:hypothetical protein n=1 Tax=Hyphomonas sp. TaxID=87 RepID=UPI00333FA3F3